VFNFDVVWAPLDGGLSWFFFCSTEEGALWMRQASGAGQLSVSSYQTVAGNLGSGLCCQAGRLALTANDLLEFLFDGAQAPAGRDIGGDGVLRRRAPTACQSGGPRA
jgi:hypothetical protein